MINGRMHRWWMNSGNQSEAWMSQQECRSRNLSHNVTDDLGPPVSREWETVPVHISDYLVSIKRSCH